MITPSICLQVGRKIKKEINHSFLPSGSFVNLEHIYLAVTSLPSIKSKKLKTCDCSSSGSRRLGNLLDCPELQALAIDWEEADKLVLKCPKLRYLKCVSYGLWISKLDSLEVLNLQELENSEDVLSNHPKLHTLNVFRVEKAVLEELVRSARELRRGHLKLFVRSLPVDRELLEAFDEVFDKKRDLDYFTAKGVELYAKHEQQFKDDFFVFDRLQGIRISKETVVNLKLLIDRTSIFRKIFRAHTLKVSGRSLSQEELIDLIKQMPNARWLTSYGDVPQAFFDQLPTILPFLNGLIFCPYGSKVLNDLSFLLKFQELRYVSVWEYKESEENKRILKEFRATKAFRRG